MKPEPDKLLFVVDLEITEDSFDALQDGLLRAGVFAGGSRDVSLVCLYSREKDKAILNQYLSPGQQAGLQLFYLQKDSRQLAPGMMSQACLGAYLLYQWLKLHADRFDLVHAFDSHNVLYFALVARQLGMHFGHIRFVHICCAPLLLLRDVKHQPVDTFTDLARLYMERQSAAMSDYVLARSNWLLAWLESNGYQISGQKRKALPPMLPVTPLPGQRGPDTVADPGFVYLGDLGSRAEMLIYLDAFKRMLESCRAAGVDLSACSILFVSENKPSKRLLREIRELFDSTDCRWSIRQADLFEFVDSGEALGRLALLPPQQPGYNLVAVKLLQAGAAVLGFLDSGIEELFDEASKPLLVRPHPHDLGQAMTEWLANGPIALPAAISAAAVLRQYQNWYGEIANSGLAPAQPASTQRPLVSVCIAHFNRPTELRQALDSVSRLQYPNLEVIVVDDGSTDPGAIRYLQTLEGIPFPCQIRVFTQPNLYLGASRNLAARNARGKYLLFMDDDNLAKPEELDVLVSAAEYSQMDILTCFADAFIKDGEIGNSSNTNRIVFTGADIAAGFFRNPYGDSNCLVLKRSFDALGGFSEDYKIGRDDQEFFSRAILKGFRLQVVPEALYWYKINTSRMRQTQFSQYAGLLRVARPYYQESGFDAHWLDIMRYAQGMSAQKSGLTAKGLKRYAQSNRLRMIAYAFPGLYKWLRPLLRRL